MKLTPAQSAELFVSKCKEAGFNYFATESGIVTVSKTFEKGDKAAFVDCDGAGPFLIALVPASGGSVWGTDGGGVGGYFAVVNGNYCLNVSGVKKRFLNELKKLSK